MMQGDRLDDGIGQTPERQQIRADIRMRGAKKFLLHAARPGDFQRLALAMTAAYSSCRLGREDQLSHVMQHPGQETLLD